MPNLLACPPSAPPKLGAVGSPCQSWAGGESPLIRPDLAGAAARTHPVRPPPRGWAPYRLGHITNAPPIIALFALDVPRQEQRRTVPPLPLPARPPPLKGWISPGLQTTNAPPIIAPCNPPSAPPKLGAVSSPCQSGRAAKRRFTAQSGRGCCLHPSRAPSPPGGGLPPGWMQTNISIFHAGNLGLKPKNPCMKN